MADKTALTITHLAKNYGRKPAVRDISLTVEPGEIHGFLGPNGAGKTTAIRCIMDFIRPDAGSITVFGHDTQSDGLAARRLIGYTPSDMQTYQHWTGQEHISFAEQVRGKTSNAHALANALDFDTSVKAKHLSTGNKQKLAVILALMHQPKLLIMDEPTRGLDPLLQETVYGLLHEYVKNGGTVFISSHILAEVERLCKRVTIIRDGITATSQSLKTLRGAAIHTIGVRFAKPVHPDMFSLPNCTIVNHSHNYTVWHLKVTGDLNPILHTISKHTVVDLLVNHASLEDVFMAYYSDPSAPTEGGDHAR